MSVEQRWRTVWVVDSDQHAVGQARVRLSHDHAEDLEREDETGAFLLPQLPVGEKVTIEAAAPGLIPESHSFRVRDEPQQVILGLRRAGELSYEQGDSKLSFIPDHARFLLVVRGPEAETRTREVIEESGVEAERVPLTHDQPEVGRGAEDEAAYLVRISSEGASALSRRLAARRLEVDVARIISQGEERPLGLTDEIVVSFTEDTGRETVQNIAREFGCRVERDVVHSTNAFLLRRLKGPEYDVLETIAALQADPRVIYAEANLIFFAEQDAYMPNDFLFAQVPYLQLIAADQAWERLSKKAVALRGGSPAVTVAIIDQDGVAPDHPDLTARLTDGTLKLVTSMNFATFPRTTQTVGGLAGTHGTKCAGSAVAAFDNNIGVSGVAPNCHLIGIRSPAVSDMERVIHTYLWAGGILDRSKVPGFPALPARPADVISSSWGRPGIALSDPMRACFDRLTGEGRNGLGTILCWAIGNEGYVDFTIPTPGTFRSWATYHKCIAVGASIGATPTNPLLTSYDADPTGSVANIATQADQRALYSPYGSTLLRKPDLVAPSHTANDKAASRVDPILACVPVGTGTVDGCPGPAACLDYAATFGGTSHATPTVAGAIALMLSAKPDLTWIQVLDLLRASCARIHPNNNDPIGVWQDLDGDGKFDYSRWYGAGRLDVHAAIMAILGS
jgi:Subtilase family